MENAASLRLAAYIRVSSRNAADHEPSAQEQQKAIASWAARSGHEVVMTFRDEGVSGTNGIENRTGLPQLLDALAVHDVDGLVVVRLDRLARALTTQEAILARVWALGGSVWTCESGEVVRDDPDDPMRTAMRQMAGVFAQLERSMVTLRLRNGKRAKLERGQYVGGEVAFGQRLDGGQVVADPNETRAIERMITLRAQGATLQDICDSLTAEGFRPKHGARWHANTVRRILNRHAEAA